MTDIVLLGIALVQTFLSFFSDGPSESLQRFGSSLSVYVKQISEFLSYASEEKPYPFSDWPEPDVLATKKESSE